MKTILEWDNKIQELMNKIHTNGYNKNGSLSLFNMDMDEYFMIEVGMVLDGYAHEQIVDKITYDTYNHLTEMNRVPNENLCKQYDKLISTGYHPTKIFPIFPKLKSL